MNGQQHITAGVVLTALDVAIYQDITHTWTNEAALTVVTSVKDFIMPSFFLLYPFCFVGLILGFLLPDCDTEKSLIGRVIHLPIEHRTWTHTIWFCILMALPGLLFNPFLWLGIGCIIHLFCDSFSKCGVCWFWPRYKRFGYAKIKNGHFIYLYDSDPVAWILCGVMLTLSVLYVLGILNVIPAFRILITQIDSFFEMIIGSIAGLWI